MQKNIIVFDTETNGLKECSVLSISAIKLNVDLENKEIKEIEKFNRYYFRNPDEEINEEAIKINGLTDEEILRRREEIGNYSKYFKEDTDFIDFCKDYNYFVAHNIMFDAKFMPFNLENQFCTQKSNIEIVRKPSNIEGKYKYPSLLETAEFYKINLDPEKWHGSEYDTEICKEIFIRMFQNDLTYPAIRKFLEGD